MIAPNKILAMQAAKAKKTELSAAYENCCKTLSEMGWSEEYLAELREFLKKDMADGDGVKRPFAMTPEERRECWLSWFKSYAPTTSANGINERIRQSIADDKEKKTEKVD